MSFSPTLTSDRTIVTDLNYCPEGATFYGTRIATISPSDFSMTISPNNHIRNTITIPDNTNINFEGRVKINNKDIEICEINQMI